MRLPLLRLQPWHAENWHLTLLSFIQFKVEILSQLALLQAKSQFSFFCPCESAGWDLQGSCRLTNIYNVICFTLLVCRQNAVYIRKPYTHPQTHTHIYIFPLIPGVGLWGSFTAADYDLPPALKGRGMILPAADSFCNCVTCGMLRTFQRACKC